MVDFKLAGHRIVEADNLGATPAKTYRKRKLILLNKDYFFDLPKAAQKIIILHELGHNILDTSNEFAADEFSFKQFVGSEYQSLKKIIKTLATVLPMDTTEQKQRFKEIIKQAALWDSRNGNPKALNILNKMENEYFEDYEEFFGHNLTTIPYRGKPMQTRNLYRKKNIQVKHHQRPLPSFNRPHVRKIKTRLPVVKANIIQRRGSSVMMDKRTLLNLIAARKAATEDKRTHKTMPIIGFEKPKIISVKHKLPPVPKDLIIKSGKTIVLHQNTLKAILEKKQTVESEKVIEVTKPVETVKTVETKKVIETTKPLMASKPVETQKVEETEKPIETQKDIAMTGSQGFSWGFVGALVLVAALVAGVIYLKNKTS